VRNFLVYLEGTLFAWISLLEKWGILCHLRRCKNQSWICSFQHTNWVFVSRFSQIFTLVMNLSIRKFLKWTYQKGLYNNLHVLEDFRYEYIITLYKLIWDMYVGIKYSHWHSIQNKKKITCSKITCYSVTKKKGGMMENNTNVVALRQSHMNNFNHMLLNEKTFVKLKISQPWVSPFLFQDHSSRVWRTTNCHQERYVCMFWFMKMFT
jgi:hypothetical protein